MSSTANRRTFQVSGNFATVTIRNAVYIRPAGSTLEASYVEIKIDRDVLAWTRDPLAPAPETRPTRRQPLDTLDELKPVVCGFGGVQMFQVTRVGIAKDWVRLELDKNYEQFEPGATSHASCI